jgi:hypothetical protein
MRSILFILLLFNSVCQAEPSPLMRLTIDGNGTRPVVISMDQLNALPLHTISTRTPWAARATYTGPLLKDVLCWAGARGQNLIVSALDDYSATIPISDLNQYRVILATKRNGQPLTIRERGPVRIIYPLEQIERLQTLSTDLKMVWHVNKIHIR